jgi:hypothetical protein
VIFKSLIQEFVGEERNRLLVSSIVYYDFVKITQLVYVKFHFSSNSETLNMIFQNKQNQIMETIRLLSACYSNFIPIFFKFFVLIRDF